MTNVLYFGCRNVPGHYLVNEAGRTLWDYPPALPWRSIDGTLPPGGGEQNWRNPQPEGLAALHHKDGWTALAFWDRSVDERGGCNSAFFFPETLDFDAATAAARAAFPDVWKRFTFDVVPAQ